ncbi:hypothetical protein HHK36_016696 [Tetracentron sinense]|uniref:RING-type E3 ubiquitin transferase n=1 Tax=Tetracentron sinense TaxID=13715 RepID=A0A835DEX4_TETSI|nr:hypothetical protein HHK36_016696 [Tetracentron sinense]
MIAMVGIIFTTMAIMIFHFLVAKYCIRSQATVDTQPIARCKVESGVEEMVLESIPVLACWSKQGGLFCVADQCECAVCLGELEEGDAAMINASSQPIPGCPVATGVDEKVLESIPILAYSSKRGGLFRVDQGECAVCLGELEEGDMVRLLPSCQHAFHFQCIDEWFMSHSSCPICRSPIVASMAPVLSMPIEVAEEDSIDLIAQFCEQGEVDAKDLPDLDLREGSNGLLRHCDSLIFASRRKQQHLSKDLKRSLSLDYSYISIKIQGDHDRDSSSSSSNCVLLKRSSSYKARSFRRLGRASSMLIKSFSRLRNGHGQEERNGLLPY